MDSRRVLWTAIVLFFAALALGGPVIMIRENTGGAAGAPSGEGSKVTLARIAFSPTELTVRKGTEVLFDNRDVAPHTVTADDGEVDSGTLNPGKSFKLIVNKPLDYHCEIHPSMTAKIAMLG